MLNNESEDETRDYNIPTEPIPDNSMTNIEVTIFKSSSLKPNPLLVKDEYEGG